MKRKQNNWAKTNTLNFQPKQEQGFMTLSTIRPGPDAIWEKICREPRKIDSADRMRRCIASSAKTYTGLFFEQVCLHSRKLTWNPQMEVWKMIFLFKWVIFRFHVTVSFLGCKLGGKPNNMSHQLPSKRGFQILRCSRDD